VVQTKSEPEAIVKAFAAKNTVAGFPLNKAYPELGNAMVWCVTELNTREQIDAVAAEVK
jgi:glycine cleavage system pyridoxal-binding protein P